jgi:preprotein translocase subunit SecE
VARDRQRAKQRKQRRAPAPPSREGADAGFPEPRPLHRENVPGPVEHTGEVEEFEAALVSGADGEPESDPGVTDRAAVGGDEPPTAGTTGAIGRYEGPGEATQGRGGSRFLNFLRASWAELQRVQWPDRRQVTQATAVVLGFVVLAGGYLGLADVVAQEVVDFII